MCTTRTERQAKRKRRTLAGDIVGIRSDTNDCGLLGRYTTPEYLHTEVRRMVVYSAITEVLYTPLPVVMPMFRFTPTSDGTLRWDIRTNAIKIRSAVAQPSTNLCIKTNIIVCELAHLSIDTEDLSLV